MQNGRAGRLHPAVGTARRHLAAALEKLLGAGSIKATGRSRTASTADAADLPLLLVACSGGPDSLALAAIAAHFARRGDVRVGAIIVDHGLQEDSAAVAAQTAQTLTDLGLHPVITEKVQVPVGNMGPEMAARTARYAAFTKAVEATGARAVLLGHTLDDQAETVLLGLSRGSGTRSLAGMPPVRVEEGVTYLRPFLGLRRTDMLDICDAETLTPWIDPTNTDETLMRARIRHSVLPYLEEHLGGDVARSLARTASVAGPDAEYLDEQAQA
ncbi:tRNA lysidine(34) synthetase TilS, partial [uncultured Rothia sp.]